MAKKTAKDYHTSKCRGNIMKGSARQLMDKYTEMAKMAGDEAQRQIFLNYKEHYYKMTNT